MRNFSVVVALSCLSLVLTSCNEEENGPDVDPQVLSLVTSLNEELTPISVPDPTQWTDNDLKFLDDYGSKAIVGIGEATHGTSEFFKAKHRMFRYMVENHGFKIFAIEADIGESMFINEAVMASDKTAIVSLMLTKMHFWTWRTNEVRDMLFWMCDYNSGKPAAEKLQYWGVDCQYNTFYPDMVKTRLEVAHVPFLPATNAILDQSKTLVSNRFPDFTDTDFINYLTKIEALTDSVTKYKDLIVASSSTKQFELTLHLVKVIQQASKVTYYLAKNPYNYRDEYMADNTKWLNEYHNGAKMVLWAHNFHVSNSPQWGTQGKYISEDFPNGYVSIGFLFSKGTFRAVTQTAPNVYAGLAVQNIDDEPLAGSINDVMSRASAPVFTVRIEDLLGHDEWTSSFEKGIQYFQTGSIYNEKKPEDFYGAFDPNFFDRVIFFNVTTAAKPVQ